MPPTVIPDTATVLPVPTFLSVNVAVAYAVVSTSPPTRLSESVTVASVAALYTRFTPVAETVSGRAVMSAVVLAVVLTL